MTKNHARLIRLFTSLAALADHRPVPAIILAVLFLATFLLDQPPAPRGPRAASLARRSDLAHQFGRLTARGGMRV